MTVCKFLGKKLNEEEVDAVMRQATFENMKSDPLANYTTILKTSAEHLKNYEFFLRKGEVRESVFVLVCGANEPKCRL